MEKKEDTKKLYQYIQNKRTGRKVLATILSGEHAGKKMLAEDGELICAFGGRELWEDYREVILSVQDASVIGKDCRIFCEPVSKEKELVICGGGHVSIAVIKIAKMVGFSVTVLEDRIKFADDARRAGADRVICESFDRGMKQVEGGSDTYFVIATRGHRYDSMCLEMAVHKPNAYVGMMGSRRRAGLVLRQLADAGTDPGLLEQVHTPVGLKIQAETPEEIAVSIMGEIIQIKNSIGQSGGYSAEMLKLLSGAEGMSCPAVLATIVSKKGSAPRAVGTKMLVLPDGTQNGTIGGGCMEGQVLLKARRMLAESAPDFCLMTVNMTGEEAEDAGMVCGGVEEVMLELLQQ